MLDRRWSFGTGLPFAIQDADIDPLLPEPVRIRGNGSRQQADGYIRTDLPHT